MLIALSAACLLWAGMVLGISFLETPVKFTVPSVTLLLGLDIGRYVFGAFNKVQLGLAALLMVLVVKARPGRPVLIGLGLVAIALALQTAWLLPAMDQRVVERLAGRVPPPSPLHIFYVVLEMLKLGSLIVAGVLAMRQTKDEG